jgi:hypothetical protein
MATDTVSSAREESGRRCGALTRLAAKGKYAMKRANHLKEAVEQAMKRYPGVLRTYGEVAAAIRMSRVTLFEFLRVGSFEPRTDSPRSGAPYLSVMLLSRLSGVDPVLLHPINYEKYLGQYEVARQAKERTNMQDGNGSTNGEV